MTEKTSIQQAVEKAVSEVVEGHLPQLRGDLTQRVVAELEPRLGGASGDGAGNLLKAVTAVQAGATQREILRAFLDNTVRYCGRAALFVIKSASAIGWQGRAFPNHEAVKDFALDVSSGLAARALQSRMILTGGANEIDPHFMSQFGAPADGRVSLLPLLLKEKVAALVYADAGAEAGGDLNAAALELLVLVTSAWLEVVASRKQVGKESTPEVHKSSAPAAQAPAFNDPFAGHAPIHSVAAATAPVGDPPAAVQTMAAAAGVAEPIPVAAEAPASLPADPFAGMSPEDAEVHRKAQRFARLLVDEIKLYNQAKVSEGRKNRDLYDRLKDDIDKSLATYQKRYGHTAAAGPDYFRSELVRSLAEDDIALMGANFQR